MGFGDRRRAEVRERARVFRPLSYDEAEWDDFFAPTDTFMRPELNGGYDPYDGAINRLRGRVLSITKLFRISSFPYLPDATARSIEFLPNAGVIESPRARGWAVDTLAAPRLGESSSSGVLAWGVRPTESYDPDTASWLVSPSFDFSALSGSGFFFRFWLWADTTLGDAMKLQVSTDGGIVSSDVVADVPYNTMGDGLSRFGGADDGWGETLFGGASSTLVSVDITPWEGLPDVRFRFVFVSSISSSSFGPVVDGMKVD